MSKFMLENNKYKFFFLTYPFELIIQSCRINQETFLYLLYVSKLENDKKNPAKRSTSRHMERGDLQARITRGRREMIRNY